MHKRLTAVREIDFNVVGHGSIFLVGDGGKTTLDTIGIGMILSHSFPRGSIDRRFNEYAIFRREPPPLPFAGEEVNFTRRNEIPLIPVQKIRMVAASASSFILAGSIGEIESTSKLIYIRHFGLSSQPPS